MQAFPAETTEAFCEGHNAAFRYFGGVPRGIVYDNTTLAVAKILGDGTRQRTQSFSELHSHYLFDDRFGRPGKGNDKGKVEGLVGYARRNVFVPVPRVASGDALNADLARQCRARRGQRLRRHTETIGERFARDRAALLPLPPVPYEACDTRPTRDPQCRRRRHTVRSAGAGHVVNRCGTLVERPLARAHHRRPGRHPTWDTSPRGPRRLPRELPRPGGGLARRGACRPSRGVGPTLAGRAVRVRERQDGSVDYTTTRGRWERKELRMKDVIALLNDKRSELLDSVARIDAAIAALDVKQRPSAPSKQPAKRRRREMSAEAKQAVSDRMKNYWAERRTQAETTSSGDAENADDAPTGA